LRSGHSPRTVLAAGVADIVGRLSILASPSIATMTRPDVGGQEAMLPRNRDLGPREIRGDAVPARLPEVANSPPGTGARQAR
jgi:hypothetical protein